MNLSHHFTLDELTSSQTATRFGIDNTPDDKALANLQRLALALEHIRNQLFDHPIFISSAYRCPALNERIGGSRRSSHMRGLAADFTCPGYGTPREICVAIVDADERFDQLILEGGRWVHFSIAQDGHKSRHEVLTATFAGGRAEYRWGLA